MAGLVAQKALARTLARKKRAHGVRVNIVARGGPTPRVGLRGTPVPDVRHQRLANHDRVGRLDPLHRRVVVGDEIGVAV